jgi:putative flippase GtrA
MSHTDTANPLYVRAATKPWRLLNQIILGVAGLFGSKSKEVERFLKFAVVGVIGTVVDFGTLLILQATILRPVDPLKLVKVNLAITIAFLAAITSNFLWNRFWTYPDSRSRPLRQQMVQFAFINLIGLVIRNIWVALTYATIGAWLFPIFIDIAQRISDGYLPTTTAEAKVGTLASTLIAVAVVMLWNFFANRYWTYSDVE